MSLEIKTLDLLISFFRKVHSGAENMVHELKFMKYNHLFGERDDDIYVATFVKSGTTWMQMILYQLTTKGDMGFEHIYQISPWLRNLADIEGEIPDLPSPRIIKTHDAYEQIPKWRKCRYIYVIRDGMDVALSLYHHRKNYVDSDITFEKAFNESFREPGRMNWFEFNRAWLENKNGLNILYVHYTDLQKNFVEELHRIAQFIGVAINPQDLPRIIERTSFQFMKKHEVKFGEQVKKKHEPVYDQFIRLGKTGEGKQAINEDQLKYFTEQFNQSLAGFPMMKVYTEELNKACQ